MDNFNGITVHLNHRDITMAAVSRAPYAKIAAYKKRMGWSFPWVSSHASDFNFDYYVSFTDEELKAKEAEYNYRLEPSAITQGPGISVFLKDGGQIYHTYSTYARGLDMLNVAYHYMELVPKGRDEGDGGATAWVRPSRRVSGLMDGGRLLPALGLVRQARPAGFCPECRVLMKALDARPELARPMVAALVVLAVAGVAWAAMVHHSRSMAGMEGMDMGLGPIKSFAATWVVMMAAMMLPSAIPVVLEFARTAECRRAWPIATGMLAVTYLGVWLLFGVVCYAIYTALRMPWPNQSVIAGLALALAGVYSFSPIKRASQARCRELCALHGPLPFNLMRSAVVAGARYGLSCLGCSAALMVAMVLVGMSSLWWAVILGVVVLVYKLAPPLPLRYELALSAALVALGVAYVMAA